MFVKNIFAFLALIFLSNRSFCAVSLPIKVEDLKEKISQAELCSSVDTALLCRGLVVSPGADEGIVYIGATAVLLISEDRSNDAEVSKMLNGVLSTRMGEMFSLVLLSDEEFLKTIYKSVATTFLVLLKDPGPNFKLKSAFFTSRNALLSFVSSTYPKWKAELPDAIGWEPPKDFVPFYQFESF